MIGTATSYVLDHCLLCDSSHLDLVVPLEPIPIATPNFVVTEGTPSEIARESVPLSLNQCQDCGHVQVTRFGNPELQYRDYAYTTSSSLGLRDHFAGYASDVLATFGATRDHLVVDIGSNDGTLLQNFNERGMRVLGVDPGRKIAEQASAQGVPTVPEFFTASLARQLREQHGAAGIVTANNVIANIPDLIDWGSGVASLLAPDGIFVFETQYGADVFERTLLDTVYHEHLSYFLMKPTCSFMKRLGMEVIDVRRVATKGGSIRVTAQLRGGPRSPAASVTQMISEENGKEAFASPYFTAFARRVGAIRERLHTLIAAEKSRGGKIAGYGVSVGTTTLLAQLGLADKIDFLIDDHPKDAVLAGPGYSIPVYSRDAVGRERPGLIVIFAWRYAQAIIEKHEAFRAGGGRFVIPLPDVTVS